MQINTNECFDSSALYEIFLTNEQSQKLILDPKQYLFSDQEPADKIFYILKGSFKLTQFIKEKEFIARIAREKDLVGHRSLFSVQNYKANAIALVPSEVLSLPKNLLLSELQENSTLTFLVMKKLATDIEESERRLHVFHSSNLKERFAKLLTLLAQTHGMVLDCGETHINLKLNRVELASMMSCAMENVVRLISEFKNEKLIYEEGGCFRVLNLKRLQEMS